MPKLDAKVAVEDRKNCVIEGYDIEIKTKDGNSLGQKALNISSDGFISVETKSDFWPSTAKVKVSVKISGTSYDVTKLTIEVVDCKNAIKIPELASEYTA